MRIQVWSFLAGWLAATSSSWWGSRMSGRTDLDCDFFPSLITSLCTCGGWIQYLPNDCRWRSQLWIFLHFDMDLPFCIGMAAHASRLNLMELLLGQGHTQRKKLANRCFGFSFPSPYWTNQILILWMWSCHLITCLFPSPICQIWCLRQSKCKELKTWDTADLARIWT